MRLDRQGRLDGNPRGVSLRGLKPRNGRCTLRRGSHRARVALSPLDFATPEACGIDMLPLMQVKQQRLSNEKDKYT